MNPTEMPSLALFLPPTVNARLQIPAPATMERMDTTDDDDFQSKSAAFTSWLQQQGASLSSKIQIADLRAQNAGRGVGMLQFLHRCGKPET